MSPSGARSVDGYMLVEGNINGSITVSALIDGHLKSMTYYGYSEREAVEIFRKEELNAIHSRS